MKRKIGFYTKITFLGGGEVYLKTLIENLNRERYDVFLFCRKDFQLRSEIETGGKTNIRLIDDIEREPGIVKRIMNLRDLFLHEKINLLHFNGDDYKVPALAARLAGCKGIVSTYHVMPGEFPRRFSRQRIKELLYFLCCRRIIHVSEAGKKAWSSLAGIKSSAKYAVIHNAVDVKKIDKEAYVEDVEVFKKSFNLGQNDKIVGMSARLHPMKGHRYLIEAAPYIREKVPGVRFLIIGDGPIEEELKESVGKNGLADIFIFTGFRKDVLKILSVCNVVVFPSIFKENFSFAALEAMVCGRPVVATSVGGFPEMVEEGITGFIVPPRNSEKLAEKVVALLNDRTVAEDMGKAGRLRVEKFFTLEKMLGKTYALYEFVFNGIFQPGAECLADKHERNMK